MIMKRKTGLLLLIALGLSVLLAACNAEEAGVDDNTHEHQEMNHSSSGELPAGLKEASNPKFPVGSTAVMNAEHMEGMNGAEATVVGAFDTTVYTISYTPTTGGAKVTNHEWVIHEEIKDAGAAPYRPGDEVVVDADHMEGMQGAKAVIDSAQQTVGYMVDYVPTTGGEPVKNHKWVTESELSEK